MAFVAESMAAGKHSAGAEAESLHVQTPAVRLRERENQLEWWGLLKPQSLPPGTLLQQGHSSTHGNQAFKHRSLGDILIQSAAVTYDWKSQTLLPLSAIAFYLFS